MPATSRIRILGIDPGSRVTGYGVIDIDGAALIERLRPDQLAIEQVFVSRNPGSALKLGAARSAAICASFGSGVLRAEYTPREIKQAVTGTGSASKEQVQHMMAMLLRIDEPLTADAADALAVAVCHANSQRLNTRLQQALAGRS